MKVARLGVAAALGIVAAGCAVATNAPPTVAPPTPLPPQPGCVAASAPRPLCVLVLGDSIAAGVPLSGNDRWWVGLDDELTAALPGRRVEVDSWAVPSSRIDVLESAATDQPALDTFDVAIIIEGVNDVGHTPIGEWTTRYERAVQQLEAHGVQVVMTTPPPNFEGGAFQDRHDGIDAAVRGLARPGRPVLDVAARFRSNAAAAATYYSDNLHQGLAGQQVIATMARDAVLGLVAPG